MPKFIEPMLSEHISGLAFSGAARRSSIFMLRPPPVVMLMTASDACLMRGRNCMKTSGSGVGSPVLGSRACSWMIAAPASAAAMLCSAISSGVIGSASDMVGVWMAPVMATLMMTLLVAWAMAGTPNDCRSDRRRPRQGRDRRQDEKRHDGKGEGAAKDALWTLAHPCPEPGGAPAGRMLPLDQRLEHREPVGLGGRLVPADAVDAREAQRYPRFVAGRALHAVE